MRDKRTDPHHLGVQFPDQQHILCQRFRRLSRRAHHKSAAGLKSYFPKCIQTLNPVIKGHLLRMQFPVMFPVCRFMSEQIPVCPCIKKASVGFLLTFPYGKGDCTVGISRMNLRHDGNNPIIRVISILSALKNKSAETESVPFFTALKDLFFREPVPLCTLIGSAYPAIITIIPAAACKLNQPSCIYFIFKVAMRDLSCPDRRIFSV